MIEYIFFSLAMFNWARFAENTRSMIPWFNVFLLSLAYDFKQWKQKTNFTLTLYTEVLVWPTKFAAKAKLQAVTPF